MVCEMKRFCSRKVALFLKVSSAASGFAMPAAAQCVATPGTSGNVNEVNCSGIDNDGYRTSDEVPESPNPTWIRVLPDAVVMRGGAAAAIDDFASNSDVNVKGRVDGAGGSGLLITAIQHDVLCTGLNQFDLSCAPGTIVSDYSRAQANVSIDQDGIVNGSNGLVVRRSTNKPRSIYLGVDNAGSITGTDAPAILIDLPPTAQFGGATVTLNDTININNRSSGFIGGIFGSANIINAGIIEGKGTLSALSAASLAISNDARGLIRSDSAPTVEASDGLTITNALGATIRNSQAGGTAILTNGALTLTNKGRIDGSVTSLATAGQNSLVDISGGQIIGNLRLGAGDDTLRADYDIATGAIGGITGTIDGGAGFDTLAFNFDRDATLTSFGTVGSPVNFERFGFNLIGGARVRLANTVSLTSGIAATGAGTLINDGVIDSNGTAIAVTANSNTQPPIFSPPLRLPNIIENNGRITASLSNGADYAIATANQIVNNGQVSAQGGNGVRAQDLLVNSGQISASGTAATILFGSMDNSGSIQSTAGLGVDLGVYQYAPKMSFNSGNISGATTGLLLRGAELVNSGTISGQTTGISGSSTNFKNSAGGIVSGTAFSIDSTGMTIENAGLLDGNVRFAGSEDIFTDAGGSVLGAISMGAGDDLMITDLSQPAGRPLAGATQGVDAGSGIDTIRYVVKSNASADMAIPQSFEQLGFQLEGGAHLTLSQPTLSTVPLQIGGDGLADLYVDLATTDASALTLFPGSSGVTTHGTLTAGSTGGGPAIAVVSGKSDYTGNTIPLVNEGRIIAGSSDYGVRDLETFTNNGEVQIDNGVGVFRARTVINTGIIDNASGSGGDGVAAFETLINSGTIRTGGTAVTDLGKLQSWNNTRIDNSGLITSTGGDALALYYGTFNNASTGQVIGRVTTNIGTIVNDGLIQGDIDLTGFGGTVANSGTVTGNLNLDGAYHDISNSGTLSGNVTGGLASGPTGDGSRSLILNTGRIEGSVDLSGSINITNSGTIAGDIDLRGPGARLNLSGAVGNVSMRGGANELYLAGNWSVGGSIEGGGDADMATIDFNGTPQSPQIVNLAAVRSFEEAHVRSGAGVFDGNASFDRLFIDNGSLVGRAGSTLTSTIVVAENAAFGSAGTVNGDIRVIGMLSPGASPGTMTVNGNVDLEFGSVTRFEFTPTVSDAIVVNGTFQIRDGARLVMTGERPLTPGTYRMVTASNGVIGTFGPNVTRDGTVLGVLNYSPTSVDLIGMFQLRSGASAQVTATKDYLNALLLNTGTPAGFYASFSTLLAADGYASPAMLARLSPEPYASVAQMGIENGLAISKALRDVSLAWSQDDASLFAFGQAYGNWRTFDDGFNGTADADISTSGYLGGIGYGTRTLGAALFVGRGDSRQPLRGIGSQNDADGLFFGGRLHFAAGGFSGGASLTFDRARAETVRNPAGGSVRSRYDLHGTTVDGWLRYDLDVGGWRMGPQLGLTHTSVNRGQVDESGGGVFELNVAKRRYTASFLTANFRIAAPTASALRPWATAGIRTRIGGNAIIASGGFAGTAITYSVAGAARKKTLPHLGGGLDMGLSSQISLFVNGDVEFSDRNAQRQVNAGVTVHF